jgi:hypothetical protein
VELEERSADIYRHISHAERIEIIHSHQVIVEWTLRMGVMIHRCP